MRAPLCLPVPALALALALLASCGGGAALRFPGFFIPEEVQTILSVFYSHLPPTRIGSDKRFGVGFRLGRNADAQILIELGPQTDTEPLADAGAGFSKRENPADSRRQPAGRVVNKKRLKTADSNTSASDITNAFPQETVIKISNATAPSIEVENKTEPSVKNKKKKPRRPKKKAKSIDVSTEASSSRAINQTVTNKISQTRQESFMNNFMNWLNGFNQQRNVS